MMSIIQSIASPTSMLYWLNLALVVTLICAASLVLAKVLQKRSEVFRHAFVVASLLVLLVTPIAIWVGSHSQLGLLTIKSPQPPEIPSQISPEKPAEILLPWEEFVPSPTLTDQDAVGTAIAGPSASEAASPPGPVGVDIPWAQLGFSLLLATWCLGTLCFVFQTIRGGLLIRRHLRLSTLITEGCMLAASKSAARKAGLAKLPPIFKSQLVPVPVSTGVCYSAVILPEDFLESAKQDELESVLIHELGHIVRRDHWVGLVQRLTVAIFWWNPLVYRISRLCSSLAEEICDDYATESLQSGEDFARTLLAMAERVVKHLDIPLAIEILPARRHDLERRITRLMQKERKMKTRLSLNHIALASVFGLVMIGATVLSTVWADSRVDIAADNSRTEAVAVNARDVTAKGPTDKADSPDNSSTEQVNLADSASLSGNIAARSQATLRLLQEGNFDQYSGWSLSPDGLKMAYTFRRPLPKVIIVSDLSTGVERTYEETTGGNFSLVWSPDGKKIAFLDTKDDGWHVSILTLESGDVEKTDIRVLPCDWSRDGRFLLVISNAGGLQLVDLETGETQAATATGTYDIPRGGGGGTLSAYTGSPRLSPDGTCVAFSHSVGAEESDIFVQSIGSDERIRVTSHKRRDWNPLWSPDGKNILFQSNRKLGRSDLLSVAIQNGKPMGEPRIIAPNLGDGIALYSCSNSGCLLFVENDTRAAVCSSQVDPVSGRISRDYDQLTNSKPQSRSPNWSRNGQYIAYTETSHSEVILCVMNSDGRDKRKLCRVRGFVGSQAWYSDNEHVLYGGWQADPKNPEKWLSGIYSVSIRSRERKLIYHDPNFRGGMGLSPDGKHLALTSTSGTRQKPQLYIVDYDGQNRRQLVKSDGAISSPVFTRDGKEIIYKSSVTREGKTSRQSIMAVPFEGGESREIYSSENLQGNLDMGHSTWLADGRLVFDIKWGVVSASLSGPESRTHCAISLDGKSEFVKLSTKIGNGFRVSPDGTRAVFCVPSRTFKTWLMSDFLPNVELAMK